MQGFNSIAYRESQSEKILERLEEFSGRLYLEFGGKLEDAHASRVLPGYDKNEKLRILEFLKDRLETVIVVSALDLESLKFRSDTGISYLEDCLKTVKTFKNKGIPIAAVVVTRVEMGNKAVDRLERRLRKFGVPLVRHGSISGYPQDTVRILECFLESERVPVSRDLVVVTAPGPGSGKLATCLQMIAQDAAVGLESGFSKFETFPVWDLPLSHPVNLAYEAATADLGDSLVIDPFYLDAFNEAATSYNRDVEAFPLLQKLLGDSYESPTGMGVNAISAGIVDDGLIKKAAIQEIIARFLEAKALEMENGDEPVASARIERTMSLLEITVQERVPYRKAFKKFRKSGMVSAAIAKDKTTAAGKETRLLSAPTAAVINFLKERSGIAGRVLLLSPETLKPIRKMRKSLGDSRPLGLSEVLPALAIEAQRDNLAELAVGVLPFLKGSELHCTVKPTLSDLDSLRALGVRATWGE